MSESESRGSEELLRAYEAGGLQFHDEFIKNLFAIVPERQFTHVLTKGIPQPVWLHATFAAGGAGEAREAVDGILGLISQSGIPAEIRIFPKGIPWPEQFMATVTVNEQLGR